MRNDGKPWNPALGRGGRQGPHASRGAAPSREEAASWLWGWHAVEAALNNADREAPTRVLATADRAKAIVALRPELKPEIADPQEIARRLPQGAVHQGVALKTPPLEGVTLAEIAEPASGVILMLDQVTDPQNVGAILRSAAAFGARGVVMQDRHAPPLGGALAKAAAGALERVPVVRAVNLSRALEQLAEFMFLKQPVYDSDRDADGDYEYIYGKYGEETIEINRQIGRARAGVLTHNNPSCFSKAALEHVVAELKNQGAKLISYQTVNDIKNGSTTPYA